ncbi:MAG TPA: response regulator [Acidobacteriota bacterium]|nr:response regulator [Acidobacteriota bacterium]
MIRILVVDDDRHMRTACARVLTAEGWTVTCAATGEEALRMIRDDSEKIDVVLVDRLMPGAGGMEVLVEIRALQPNLPVIIMSGSVNEESTAEMIREGACGCLAKPFTPDQLRDMIKKAVV